MQASSLDGNLREEFSRKRTVQLKLWGDGMRNIPLKGHCHAIWQLYKKLESVFASSLFQN